MYRVCVCGPQLSSQQALVCGELKEVQEQLRKVTEEMRRRDRRQEEHQRESQRFKEEQDSLQRHREQLEDELQEFRYRTHLTIPNTPDDTRTHLNMSLLHLNTP